MGQALTKQGFEKQPMQMSKNWHLHFYYFNMEKLDLTKKYKSYYTAKTKPETVDIDDAQYLSIIGKGDPSDKLFAENIEALYSVAYTIKFSFKALNKDFVVAKLEGLWWYDENKYKNVGIVDSPKQIPRSEWEYRLLIRMPDFVNKIDINDAIKIVIDKKWIQKAKLIELFKMTEGKVVQMLHVGPFDKEQETLQVMTEYIKENKFSRNGLHHEIYLSDFRKTESSKLKTILREPIK